MHASDALGESDRVMTVCNSCRYCEGLCAVFPAMELRRVFNDGDLNYLANLCHSCGACYIDCQYSPPHEFDVNVPKTLAQVRKQSYATYAWPHALSGLLGRNGLAVSLVAALSVAAFLIGFVGLHDPRVLFGAHSEAASFYTLMPHNAMVVLFGAAFFYALAALTMGARNFWRDIGEPAATLTETQWLWQAIRDAAQLRYLGGEGAGCYNTEKAPDHRRLHHHLTFYGFLLCFAATCAGTLYYYLLHREAPFPWYDLPVLLGTIGGIGLVVGPAGLLFARRERDPIVADASSGGMDVAFLAMLFLTSLTGLALLGLHETPAMGITLAVHLGFVFALFLSMPYGKFVHGIYRFLALVRYAREERQIPAAED